MKHLSYDIVWGHMMNGNWDVVGDVLFKWLMM